MPTEKRRAWIAENPVEKLHSELDKAWNNATSEAYEALDRTVDKGGYAVRNPIDALQATGEFAEDLVEAGWENLQAAHGIGQMWWNQITRVVSTPCEDKWMVLVETALPAAGDAMWLLLVPSPSEILEEYLNPYPSKTGRRGTKGNDADSRKRSKSGRLRRAWPRIPDIDAMIANAIPGGHAVRGRDAGAGQRFIFKGIDLADRVLWYYLLAEVTETFIVGWTSNMREARFCSRPWNHIGHIDYQEDTSSSHPNFSCNDSCTIEEDKNLDLSGSNDARFLDDSALTTTATGEAYIDISYMRLDTGGDNPQLRLIVDGIGGDGSGRLGETSWRNINKGQTLHLSIAVEFAQVEVVTWSVDLRNGNGADFKRVSGSAVIFGN